ncbi:hypothetical protein [Cupriavidus campinensis]|uniref:Uncharacterized protein n=1 Tax=Cupriavidus campinensis TaxID=151783 RepID=A0AAE9I2C9_9BURK|nr:hypothetical protein [Cupriavidus campinensis]URF05041.1 hypothetical protein M5D45_04170 [Cupriavidus campinensis]
MPTTMQKIIVGAIAFATLSLSLALSSQADRRLDYLASQRDIRWIGNLAEALQIMHITDRPGMVGIMADRNNIKNLVDAETSEELSSYNSIHFLTLRPSAECINNVHQKKIQLIDEFGRMGQLRWTNEQRINELTGQTKEYIALIEKCKDVISE